MTDPDRAVSGIDFQNVFCDALGLPSNVCGVRLIAACDGVATLEVDLVVQQHDLDQIIGVMNTYNLVKRSDSENTLSKDERRLSASSME